ncbi:MAG: hypothetical protein DIU78_023015 [Pseudomonadota bacterium]
MRRFVPLVRFSHRRLGELLGMRIARLYGVGIAASYGVALALVPADVRLETAPDLLRRALAATSWIVAGFSGLSLARDLAVRDRSDGIEMLAALRGYDARQLELARSVAGALRIAMWSAAPIVALALLVAASSGTLRGVLLGASFTGFALVYAALLGVTVAALSRAGAGLSPRRGRLVFAAFILLPHAARLVSPSTPSVPAAFAWLLEQSAALSGALG